MKKITFFVPVLNEEKNIIRCLKSIRKQNYPQYLVEIFIADAGCSDNTIKLAKNYNITYFFNKKKLSEYAYKKAIKMSKGDFFVFFAADNELTSKYWIRKMLLPFENKNILASYTHIAVPKISPLVNKYYSELHVEPLSWFIYRDDSNPKYFSRSYKIKSENKNHIIFDFEKNNFPLIATAQGFVYKKSKFNFINSKDGDDIMPVIQMIKKNKQLAYVKKIGVYHHHINSLLDYFKKYSERVRRSLLGENKGFKKRKLIYSSKRKIMLYMFIPYSFSLIFPLIDGIYLTFKSKKFYMLLHILMTPLMGILILNQYLKKLIN